MALKWSRCNNAHLNKKAPIIGAFLFKNSKAEKNETRNKKWLSRITSRNI